MPHRLGGDRRQAGGEDRGHRSEVRVRTGSGITLLFSERFDYSRIKCCR
jgi:hypothetical protein